LVIFLNNEIFITNLEIIINRNLNKKGIIDDNTYIKANEKLLKKIKELQF
jgi:hypothetical protein